MSTRWIQLVPLALGAVFAVLFIGPALNEWSHAALGAPGSVAPAELWRIWACADHGSGNAVHMGFPAAAESNTSSTPLATAIVAALASKFGTAAGGWNSTLLGGYLVLIGGTLWLVQRLSPDTTVLARSTFVTAVVGAASWSPLLLHLGAGAVSVMLTPLFLALLHIWIQPRAHWAYGVATGIVYGSAMLGPWPLTVLCIAMTIPMAVVMARHLEGRDVLVKTGTCMVPGLLLGVALIAYSNGGTPAYNVPPEALAPAWIHQIKGALVLPATASVALPSLGILLLALAGVAARPRGTAGWLLVATWGILLAGGTEPESTRFLLPAHHMSESIPVLQQISSWWLVAPLVSIPLGIAAMRGVESLHKVHRDGIAAGILLLAIVDQVTPGLVHDGARVIDVVAPTGIATVLGNLPEGAVLQLPQSRDERIDTHRLWQRTHKRAISTANPDGPDGGTLLSYLARLSNQFVHDPPARPSADSPLDPTTYMCAAADLATLHDLGFSAVLLDKKIDAHPAHEQVLQMVLGDPVHTDEATSVWSIRQALLNDPPAPCALPPLTRE